MRQKFNVIGLMSGTSLDGLDVCNVTFVHQSDKWSYTIYAAKTYDYSPDICRDLMVAHKMNAFDFVLFGKQYGKYIGKVVNQFMQENNCTPDFIASHGHTIFHQTDKGLTCQIGDGAVIAAEAELPVICDFRSLDVALGGQGAPLVPIGDKLLFANYDYCLNIGGFANISFENNGQRLAYDTCPANIVLNYYANKLGEKYDDGGQLASLGEIEPLLLNKLNIIKYYTQDYPKSLGREWVEQEFIPVVESFDVSIKDKLATVCEHIAIQIASSLKNGKLLITGGGVYNTHLVNCIKKYSDNIEVIIPDKLTVDFKEALIFAFLGVLYTINQPNCLASVTGAKVDNIGGAMYKGIVFNKKNTDAAF